jgi:hypothetical protein
MTSPQLQWIDSKVYSKLLNNTEVDPYALISIYAKLLKGRNKIHYYAPVKNSNNKVSRGYRLLTKEVDISLTALKKYIPHLIKLDLCRFTDSGGFHLNGSTKNQKQFKNHKKKKVPIDVSGTLSQTKTSAKSIIIISNVLTSQPRAIEKKLTLHKRLKAREMGFATLKEIKSLKKAEKNGLNKKVTQQTILSNEGIKRLLSQNKPISKQYWKKKLIKEGYLLFRRRFLPLQDKTMSYREYLLHKPYTEGNATYKNGRLVRELTSEVIVVKNNFTKIHSYNSDLMVSKLDSLKGSITSCHS